MSILARLKKVSRPEGSGAFAIVTGPRLGGKSTAAGTLEGKTLLLQAAIRETGSRSALALAKEKGNDLEVVTFSTLDEIVSVLRELKETTEYDNIYIDSYTALTEMKYKDPKIAVILKKNMWDAFREIGDFAEDIVFLAKGLTEVAGNARVRNVFVTCALKVKTSATGDVIEAEIDTKGKMATTLLTKLGPIVVTALPPEPGPDGKLSDYRLVTKSDGTWFGRIDGVLPDRNPSVITPSDLSTVIKLWEGA